MGLSPNPDPTVCNEAAKISNQVTLYCDEALGHWPNSPHISAFTLSRPNKGGVNIVGEVRWNPGPAG